MSVEDFGDILGRQFNKEFVLWDDSKNSEDDVTDNTLKSIEWMTNELKQIEERLNDVKVNIRHVVKRRGGDAAVKWRSHTMFTHTLKELPKRILMELRFSYEEIQPSYSLWDSLYTQAYCKFMELLVVYPELTGITEIGENCFRSLHLCEAPGGFVCALRDFLHGKLGSVVKMQKSWRWWMNSLDKQYEPNCLDVDLSMIKSDSMVSGPNKTGNIFDWDDKFVEEFISKVGQKFFFVTIDGSFDCTPYFVMEGLDTKPFHAGLAPSANCGCSICSAKITKGSLRIGERVLVSTQVGARMIWSHFECFAKWRRGVIKNLEEISGYELLNSDHKQAVRERLMFSLRIPEVPQEMLNFDVTQAGPSIDNLSGELITPPPIGPPSVQDDVFLAELVAGLQLNQEQSARAKQIFDKHYKNAKEQCAKFLHKFFFDRIPPTIRLAKISKLKQT